LVKVKITLRELRWMTLKRLSPPTQKAASENDSSFVLILKEQVIVRLIKGSNSITEKWCT
jgi:hypothetical protein